MPKHETLNTDNFLNRLALDKMVNPASIDAVKILKDIFNFSDQENMQNMFMSLCQAALADKYSWEKGSPGNLLYFSERLEQVIEACYLIHIRQKAAPAAKKAKAPENTGSSRQPIKKKASEPFDVVNEFFSTNSLPEWKLALHNWMEAALSNYSVTESVNSPEILTFYQQIGKLIDAAYLIGKRSGKNK